MAMSKKVHAKSAKGQQVARQNMFRGIQEELKLVTWPTRQEATELTATVIIISLIVALFVGIIDFSLAKALETLSH
jgi:preprotein translocase SecE subunit